MFRKLFVLLLVSLLSVSAGAATLGVTSVGTQLASPSDYGGQEFAFSIGTAPVDGTATKIWFHVTNTNGGAARIINVGLRVGSAGSPSTLLASGNPSGQSLAASFDGWISVTINQAITSGTEYFLTMYGEAQVKAHFEFAGANGLVWQNVTSAPALNSTWVQVDGTGTAHQISAYLEYTPAGGGGLLMRRRRN